MVIVWAFSEMLNNKLQCDGVGILRERRGRRVGTVRFLVAAETTFLFDNERARNDKPFFTEIPIYFPSLRTWALLIGRLSVTPLCLINVGEVWFWATMTPDIS